MGKYSQRVMFDDDDDDDDDDDGAAFVGGSRYPVPSYPPYPAVWRYNFYPNQFIISSRVVDRDLSYK